MSLPGESSPRPRTGESSEEVAARPFERRGRAACAGIGIGHAYVLDRREVVVPHKQVEPEELEEERKRFKLALRETQDRLRVIKSSLTHGEHRQILHAQLMMLRDPDLTSSVLGHIADEGINAEWAVAKATDDIRTTLSKAAHELFQERQFDVAFIAEQLLLTLSGEENREIKIPEGAIVVAHELSPADTAALHTGKVAGILTEEGGKTSHTAIMARALEIPGVVGAHGVAEEIRTGDIVIVDGVHGLVIVHPDEALLERYREEAERYLAFSAKIHKEHALPGITLDGVHIGLRANLAIEAELDAALFHGAEGVGLYRTEFMFMNRDDPPREEEHYQVAKQVLSRCKPYPVVFRVFDLGSDKASKFFPPAEPEPNPAMGLRSMRLALRNREHLLTQLRGLLRAGLHGPLHIMLPLISGLEELEASLEAVDEARAQLAESGMAHAEDVPVGIMIEVPSAAIVADQLAKRVDFMSIGTNDLIQYTLAIDRENDEVNYLYNPLHPAILRLIRQVCEAGTRERIRVSLCGETASDPLLTWVLIGLGVRDMSMHPAAIPVVKNVIRSSRIEEMQELADAVLSAGSSRAARRLVSEQMRERFPEHLEHGSDLLDNDTWLRR